MKIFKIAILIAALAVAANAQVKHTENTVMLGEGQVSEKSVACRYGVVGRKLVGHGIWRGERRTVEQAEWRSDGWDISFDQGR